MVLTREPIALPRHGILRPLLNWDKQPLIGFGQSRLDSSIGGLLLPLRLAYLVRVKIQCFSLMKDGRPSQVAPNRLIKVLQAGLINDQEDQSVLEEARRAPPVL